MIDGPEIPGAAEILSRYPSKRSAMMPLLYAVAERDGYVTEAGMEEVAEHIGLTPAEVLGVCSFYSMFKRTPQGKLLVSVCTSVSCMVNGGEELFSSLRTRYADDPDVTVEEVECLAADDGAPVMQVNYEFHERMTPAEAERIVEDYKAGRLTPRGPSGASAPAGAGGQAP
jgi:NADH-quinone oxidoreductase subunit E